MKTILKIVTILIFSSLFFSKLIAQEKQESGSKKSEFKHALNFCPTAPVFGIYALNYEYLFSPKNGIVARIEYEDIPKTYTDANIESSGMAYSLNYRRHLAGELNSLFVGAYARYKSYRGDGEIDSEKFDFTLPYFTIGLNAGKRWVWNSGFNITLSAGYGLSIDKRNTKPGSIAINAALDQLNKDYFFMSPLYGELSIGLAF